nr:MAG TPA: hypothetical protein [Caudoviricetes sp.]
MRIYFMRKRSYSLAEGDYSMNKKEEDKTIIRIVVLVSSILLMKIGKEYLGMILFALFVINDIILIIKNYLNKWRND